jgi:hypothetical protein
MFPASLVGPSGYMTLFVAIQIWIGAELKELKGLFYLLLHPIRAIRGSKEKYISR